LRGFARGPGFTLIAAGSLALAIGANTAIFSLAKEVLYERLGGVPHPESLRLLRWNADRNNVVEDTWGGDHFGMPDGTTTSSVFSYPVYRELRTHNQAMQDLSAFKEDWMNATIRGSAQRLQVEMVSGNYYRELAVQPLLGRAIQEGDDAVPGSGAVALISDRVWEREFDRSSAVLGQTIKLNDIMLTIIGVNPRRFGGAWTVMQSADVMVPLAMQPLLHPLSAAAQREEHNLDLLADGSMWWLNVMARVKPDVSDSEARAALSVQMNAAVRATMKVKAGESIPRIMLSAGGRGLHFISDYQYSKPLYVLAMLTALVLLLSCTNIANLLLARSAQRQREISVRLAIGASGGRILRQLFTESLLLAGLGGLVGLFIGYVVRNAIPTLVTHNWEQNGVGVPIDWRVFSFTATITIVSGILFGLAPAWSATHIEIGSNLKESAQTMSRHRKGVGGKTLVGVQIALSTLLVVGAGLFIRTLFALNAVDLGFHADHLVLFEVNPPGKRYPDTKSVQLHERLEEALAAVPGVDAVTSMSDPLLAGVVSNQPILVEGEAHEGGNQQSIDDNKVGNTFFETMGIPVIAGRGFGSQDTASSPLVAVINQRLAQTRFAGRNPVGRRFKFGMFEKNDWVQVIGICGNTHFANLRESAPPQFFIPYEQRPWEGGMTYAVRTHLDSGVIVPSLRRVVQSIDADLPMMNVRTQDEQIEANMQTERTFAVLTTGFGLLALALACVGTYGVMSYSVLQRKNEIGIRVALGAQPGQVRRLILGESTLMTVTGILVGLSMALLLTRLVKSMIYGVQPYDPYTVLGCILILSTVALAASWIPARRASGIQPMEALRHE
jgi:predicted permease